MRGLIIVMAVGLLAGQASAAYIADFDTTGSAADFVAVRSQNVSNQSATVVSAGGDNRLNIVTSRGASTTTQVQYAVAPANFEGAEVALPVGNTSNAVRTEARLSFSLETVDLGTVKPFTAFGFAGFTSGTNTTNFADKIIGQVNNLTTQIVVRSGVDQLTTAPSGPALATLPITADFPDTIEMQLTANQARILYNGTPLTSADTDAQGYFNHNLTLVSSTESTGFTGDSLIPFFGLVRGAGDLGTGTMGSGIDDVAAVNVVVPEPAALSLLGFAAVAMFRRRVR